MKKLSLIVLLMVCAFSANAQTYLQHLQAKENGQGVVTVHQSAELDALVNGSSAAAATKKNNTSANTTPAKKTTPGEKAEPKKSTPHGDADSEIGGNEAGKKVAVGGTKVTGYRVQVYAGGNSRNDKNKAQYIGNQIKAAFPGQPVYVHFYSPRWICRMGNFRTYEEAQAMLAKIKAAGFPQASLVKGQITVTN